MAAGFLAAMLGAPSAAAVSCTVTAPTVAFGNYNAITRAQVTTSATISVTCAGPGVFGYVITLSAGQSGVQTGRAMHSGVNTLSYNIYTDSGYSQILGDGNGGTATISQPFLIIPFGSMSYSAPVYAMIAGGQNINPGSYVDNLIVVLTY